MKNLVGGTLAPGYKACGTSCPVKATYTCAKNAMGDCVCGGAVDGGFKYDYCKS